MSRDMKPKQRSGFQALFGGAALMSLLTACPGPIPPPPIPSLQYLTFKYPGAAQHGQPAQHVSGRHRHRYVGQ